MPLASRKVERERHGVYQSLGEMPCSKFNDQMLGMLVTGNGSDLFLSLMDSQTLWFDRSRGNF